MTGDFPAQRASNAELYPFDDVIIISGKSFEFKSATAVRLFFKYGGGLGWHYSADEQNGCDASSVWTMRHESGLRANDLNIQKMSSSGPMIALKPSLCSGIDFIIRPEPSGISQTTPMQPGHKNLNKSWLIKCVKESGGYPLGLGLWLD